MVIPYVSLSHHQKRPLLTYLPPKTKTKTHLQIFYPFHLTFKTGHLISPSIQLTNRTGAHLRPNRAANPAVATAYSRARPFFAHFWAGPRADVWDLSCLG